MSKPKTPYFAHDSAYVDEGAAIGEGTKIWHFCHVMRGAKIGHQCILGQNVHVAGEVVIGNNVKVQNNVSLYSGTVIEDDVFLGPSCVLTNVTNPRAQVNRHNLYEKTLIRRGASIGANATLVCGIEIGRYAFVAGPAGGVDQSTRTPAGRRRRRGGPGLPGERIPLPRGLPGRAPLPRSGRGGDAPGGAGGRQTFVRSAEEQNPGQAVEKRKLPRHCEKGRP